MSIDKRLNDVENRINSMNLSQGLEEKYVTDPKLFIENYLWIKTKESKLSKLKFNSPQQKIYSVIEKLKSENKPIRLIILKARQEGVSTLSEALIFHATVTKSNVFSLLVAHDFDGSDNIFSMSQLFYDKLPEDIKPVTKYSNRKELDFKASMSKITVDTSNNLTSGRSFTIHNFHGSEVAFWKDASAVMLGISQAIPDHKDTMIILESTANGIGDFFYTEYFKAKNKESDYTAIFLPWYDMPEYSRKLDIPEREFILSLDDEEKDLWSKLNLSLEQIVWRRWAIKNKCAGDIELFRQEYPASDNECFLVSGRPVFDVQKLYRLQKLTKKPVKRGYLDKELKIEDNEKGYIKFWKLPEKEKKYVIGVDTASGEAVTTSTKKDEVGERLTGDYSCAQVIDMKTREQVAIFHGHVDTDLFAIELDKLGRFYNDALLAIESNGHGQVAINKLREKYFNLYIRRIYDRMSDKWVDRYGWETNRATKTMLTDLGKEYIREDLVTINDSDTIYELMTFVLDSKGLAGAQPGAFDDRVMSLLIGLKAYEEAPKEDYKVTNYMIKESDDIIERRKQRLERMMERSGLVIEEKEYDSLERVKKLY